MAGERALHILSAITPDTPSDARLIEADCGHQCTASDRTHDMLSNTALRHVIYCITCFAKETD